VSTGHPHRSVVADQQFNITVQDDPGRINDESIFCLFINRGEVSLACISGRIEVVGSRKIPGLMESLLFPALKLRVGGYQSGIEIRCDFPCYYLLGVDYVWLERKHRISCISD